ncbi:hypothetical protein GQ53DRAFT_745374 [Thozetella sp. PMI_491]|nr:hypothetical protein GQ53DRAFT_745374 [Thozetella sp. PMI_491]
MDSTEAMKSSEDAFGVRLSNLPKELRVPKEELPSNMEKATKILVEYGHIPPEEVEPHLRALRQKAWAICPYPCIGQWRFLDFYITTRPEYPEILRRLKSGETFLDAGTCFGYVLRQLTFDGAPQESLFGTDLRQDFIDLGYELFRDRDTFRATFATGNLLDDADLRLDVLDGKMDIIHAASLFHLFPWEQQMRLGKRVIRFFKPDARQPMLVGRQVGSLAPEPHPTDPKACIGRGQHSVETFRHLWDLIGEQTGTRWAVEASIKDEGDDHDPNRIILRFVVTKLK